MKLIEVIVAIVLGMGLGCEARAVLADEIKVIVHDSIITAQQFDNATAPFVDELRRQYRNEPQLFEKKVEEAQQDALEQLLERLLILRDFETSVYTNGLPDSIVDAQLQAYIRSNFGDDRVRFIKTLQAEGKTFEQYRKEYRERFIVEQMRYSHSSSEVIISPHKIEVYYVDHTNQFKVESEVKLRMIVLNKAGDDTGQARKLADEILAKIDEGAAFAEMASIYSQGSQRSQGGEWDWVEKSVLRKELADVAFALKKGQRSGVIDTPEACYLMLVEDQRPAHTKPLSEVRDEIERTLLVQERERLQNQWIEGLKKKTFVRYLGS